MAFFAQIVRYGLVGASATLFDAGGYWLLTRSFPWFREHYLIANAASFAVALVWAYLMHRRFTFQVRHGRHLSQFPKFAVIAVVGLGISSAVLAFGVSALHLYDLLAKLLAIVVTALWSFSGQRFWTFRAPRGLSEPPNGPYTGPA